MDWCEENRAQTTANAVSGNDFTQGLRATPFLFIPSEVMHLRKLKLRDADMPKRIQPLLLACTGIGLVLVTFAAPAIEPNPKNISLFLETYCLKCHSGENVKGCLLYTSPSPRDT